MTKTWYRVYQEQGSKSWNLERQSDVSPVVFDAGSIDEAEVFAEEVAAQDGLKRVGDWVRSEKPEENMGYYLRPAQVRSHAHFELANSPGAGGIRAWDEYQAWAASTVIYGHLTEDAQALYEAGKFASEAAEVFQVVAKLFRDQSDQAEVGRRLVDELGDSMWYLAQILRRFEIPLGEVLKANREKLEGRKARGTLGGSGER